jgi:tetratricopeptide (TPR) repeat protein
MRHRHDEALALAERSLELHESMGSRHGLAVALATLGQTLVLLGDLERAEQVLNRALEVRSPVLFHETTGAVFDTLAQIHLMRGSYERAGEYLRHASEAYGGQASGWYEWSLKVLGAKLAIRRGAYSDALQTADEIARTPGVPPPEALQAELAACEALMFAGPLEEAEQRLAACEARLDRRATPSNWGEYLRLRGAMHDRAGRPTEAYHDFAQSANVFDLLGERYQAALSQLALGRLAARAGARSTAERYLGQACAVFRSLGAVRDLHEAEAAAALLNTPGTGEYVGSPADADDALVRRLVDAAILPDLLAKRQARCSKARRWMLRLSSSPRLAAMSAWYQRPAATPRWRERSRAPHPSAAAHMARGCSPPRRSDATTTAAGSARSRRRIHWDCPRCEDFEWSRRWRVKVSSCVAYASAHPRRLKRRTRDPWNHWFLASSSRAPR